MPRERYFDAAHGKEGAKPFGLHNPVSNAAWHTGCRQFREAIPPIELPRVRKDALYTMVDLVHRVPRDLLADAVLFEGGGLNFEAVHREIVRRTGLAVDRKTIVQAVEHLNKMVENFGLTDRSFGEVLANQLSERLRELRIANEQLSADKGNPRLIEEVGYRALRIARISVNWIVLEGRTLSILPGSAPLEEDQQVLSEFLSTSRMGSKQLEPIAQLAGAIARYGRTGEIAILGAQAARAAVAFLGSESLGGALARMQYAFLARNVVGFYVFCAEMRSIGEAASRINPLEAREALQRFASHELTTPDALRALCMINEASLLLAVIALGESTDTDRDFRRAQELTNAYAEMRGEYESALTAELLSVAVHLRLPEGDDSCDKFWRELGEKNAAALLGDITEKEQFGKLRDLVFRSARQTYHHIDSKVH